MVRKLFKHHSVLREISVQSSDVLMCTSSSAGRQSLNYKLGNMLVMDTICLNEFLIAQHFKSCPLGDVKMPYLT